MHYNTQIRITEAEIPHWREIARRAFSAFRADISGRHGLEPDHAPDMPPLVDGLQGFIEQPYRVLMAWIPSWSPNPDAGHTVVRIDTMTASKK